MVLPSSSAQSVYFANDMDVHISKPLGNPCPVNLPRRDGARQHLKEIWNLTVPVTQLSSRPSLRKPMMHSRCLCFLSAFHEYHSRCPSMPPEGFARASNRRRLHVHQPLDAQRVHRPCDGEAAPTSETRTSTRLCYRTTPRYQGDGVVLPLEEIQPRNRYMKAVWILAVPCRNLSLFWIALGIGACFPYWSSHVAIDRGQSTATNG